jgi:hypothetical protein
MNTQIQEADVILVVGSPAYKERFEGTEARTKGQGARWEGLIITQAFYENLSRNDKQIIPILFDDTPQDAIPLSLRPFTYFHVPDQYDLLYRLLTHQPEIQPPAVGKVRTLAPVSGATEPLILPVLSAGADQDIGRRFDSGAQFGSPGEPPPSENWSERNRRALEFLEMRWLEHQLTLVLGAGVSIPWGMPTWRELLNDLVVEYVRRTYAGTFDAAAMEKVGAALQREFAGISPIQTGAFVQSRIPDDDFRRMLQNALYRRFEKGTDSDGLLSAIASMYGGIHSIVSFNFDDILEEVFSDRSLQFTTVTGGRDLARIRGLPIYHPHGYLPRSGDGSRELVFSESQYHTQYSDGHSWANVVVQRLLLESTCLFLGTSLSDPNLRRLIDLAHRQNPEQHHYFVTVANNSGDGVFDRALTEVVEASYEAMGVYPVWLKGFEQIPQLLKRIATKAV